MLFRSRRFGSDYAEIQYDDDWFGDGSGEASALVLNVENDDGSSGSGPDSLVLDAVGGVEMNRGNLRMTGGAIQFSSDVRLQADPNNNKTLELRDPNTGYGYLQALDFYVLENVGGVWFSDHITNSAAHHEKYTDAEARNAVTGTALPGRLLMGQGNFIGIDGDSSPEIHFQSGGIELRSAPAMSRIVG